MSLQSLASSALAIAKELLEPSDFNISTWMAMGASTMLIAQRYLPASLGSSLPILYLTFCFAKTIFNAAFRINTDGCFTNMMLGRWTATLSDREEEGDNAVGAGKGSDGIVMFVLGARLNHPLQKLAPGAADIDEVFQAMWREAETNRQQWGYLGRTATLVDYSDSERAPTIWLSYWTSLKGLQAFANTAAHRLGQDRYNANGYPYIGIMHETFYAPKGCWETIYDDFPPWGLGKAKYALEDEENSAPLKLRDTLKPASRRSSMFSRMGRDKVRS